MSIVRLLAVAFALLLAAELLRGVSIDSLLTAVLGALILGLLNTFVKPILILLTLPITIITLGLFIIVINSVLIAVAAWLLPGFVIASVWAALGTTCLVSVVSIFVNRSVKGNG